MNSNQSKNLTQKQKDLVKRLENIRNTRASTNQEIGKPETTRDSSSSQRRNEHARQSRPTTIGSKRTVETKRTRTSKPSEFARPAAGPPVTAAPKSRYKPRAVQPRKQAQQTKVTAKKKKHENNYIEQLSDGKKLAQAIVLSEILAKPVALRKR